MSSLKKYFNPLLIIVCLLIFNSQAIFALNWDARLARSINNHYDPGTARWVNGYEDTTFLLVIGVPASLILYGHFADRENYRQKGLQLASSLFLTYMIVYGLKRTINRKRPYARYDWIQHDQVESDPSFPSGHAAASANLTAFLWTQPRIPGYIKISSLIWAIGVGVGRIYQGVHYPADVLVGDLLGISSVLLLKPFFTSHSFYRNGRNRVLVVPSVSAKSAYLQCQISW